MTVIVVSGLLVWTLGIPAAVVLASLAATRHVARRRRGQQTPAEVVRLFPARAGLSVDAPLRMRTYR